MSSPLFALPLQTTSLGVANPMRHWTGCPVLGTRDLSRGYWSPSLTSSSREAIRYPVSAVWPLIIHSTEVVPIDLPGVLKMLSLYQSSPEWFQGQESLPLPHYSQKLKKAESTDSLTGQQREACP